MPPMYLEWYFAFPQKQADQVKGQRQQHNTNSGGKQVSICSPKKRAAFVGKIDHCSPGWKIQVAKSQKAQGGLHHNAAVYAEKKSGNQNIIQIWQNVMGNNMSSAVTLNHTVFDK